MDAVLISSAGRRVGLVDIVRRDLAALGIFGQVLAVDASPLSAAAHSCDGFRLVSRCRSEAFIPEVLSYCLEHGVKLIIPTIDPELPVYAEANAEFARHGILVNIGSPAAVAIGGNKVRTHEFLVQKGLSTVRQGTREEAMTWNCPVIVKPAAGSSGIGVRRVDGPEELASLKLEPDDIIQEFATGTEVTSDVLIDDQGKVLCVVPRRRLEVRGGEVSKGITERNEALIELVRQTAEALPGSFGVLNIQVFVDGPTMKVIEINSRFGGGYPLADAAGAHMMRWLIARAFGRQQEALDSWQAGLVMLRFDKEVFIDGDQVGL